MLKVSLRIGLVILAVVLYLLSDYALNTEHIAASAFLLAFAIISAASGIGLICAI